MEAMEVRPIVEEAIKKWPEHPGLCHLYIHLMEMSPEPHAALPACNVLRNMQTDAGHLIHMATHIDVSYYYLFLVSPFQALVVYPSPINT